jgi:TPP-dependent indolepyruvate ferredoxin oxidoreductase alpha subunit
MLNAYLENTLVYDPALCNGCDMRVDVCPHGMRCLPA